MAATLPQRLSVHKFGGTSVGTVDSIRLVVGIVEDAMTRVHAGPEPAHVDRDGAGAGAGGEADVKSRAEQQGHGLPACCHRVAVVVSAMGGKPKVTDLLLNTVSLAAAGEVEKYTEVLAAVQARHSAAIRELLPEASWARLEAVVADDLRGLHDVLRAVVLMKHDDYRTRELVSGHGELWSAQIIAELMTSRGHNFHFLDARKVLVADPVEGGAPEDRELKWPQSGRRLEEELAKAPADCHLLITGFIASNSAGVMTTLGRDGSDYSASVFGKLLDAVAVTIWTDVSGVYSADPRRVPEASVVPSVSYDEAIELAFFGAKVLHPKTMAPAVEASIPLYIRNTFEPPAAGTCICKKAATSATSSVVRGFSTVDHLALFNLEGEGLLGVVGTASKLFTALERASVNVIMIAQASSEHSICFAVPHKQAPAASKAVSEAFFREIHLGLVRPVSFTAPTSIIAAVGDDMCATPGTSGRFFAALGAAHINVLGISQGSSERNISAVVATPDATRALQAVHAAFKSTGHTLSLGVACDDSLDGVHGVLARVAAQTTRFRQRLNVEVQVRGVHTASRMLLADAGLPDDWATRFDAEAVPLDMDAFTAHIRAEHLPHWAVLDCNTCDEAVAAQYPAWLKAGLHVVTANLACAASSVDLFRNLRSCLESSRTQAQVWDESCLSAALPVFRTLEDLAYVGDGVTRVEAALCGGVNAAVHAVQCALAAGGGGGDAPPTLTFATALRQSVADGLMSVRDVAVHLSGDAMVQYAVALARRIGNDTLVAAGVSVDSLLPQGVGEERKAADVWDDVADVADAVMRRAAAAANAAGCVARYVVSVDADGSATVGLRQLAAHHPLARAHASDDCVVFYSGTNGSRPVVLQAPPATADVRAAALCSDLLRLAATFGTRRRYSL